MAFQFFHLALGVVLALHQIYLFPIQYKAANIALLLMISQSSIGRCWYKRLN